VVVRIRLGVGVGVAWKGRLYFPLISCICSWAVIGERFGAGKFVVRGGGGDYVALGGDLAGEAGYGAGY
jgi:hypothetical protein